MRSLLRLAGWGVSATAALVLAVFVAHSSVGQQRLTVAMAALTGKGATPVAVAKAEPLDAVQLARLAATETETRRLNEMVRSLNTDRDRLLTRLAAVERNLEDVTGSVRKQAAPPPTAPPPAAPPALPAPALEAPPTITAPQPTQPPAAPAEVIAPAVPAQPPDRVANVASPGEAAETEAAPERPIVGIDVGGANNFDGLRVLWNSVASANSVLFEGLHPVVTVRENSKTRTGDLRLVAGPLADVEAAARICTTLTAAKRYCRPVEFEGQPLALVVPGPPRRSKAVPERKAAPPRQPAFPKL